MTWRGCDPAIEMKSIDEVRSYIRSLTYSWRPSNFVIHNTASPTLYQWWHSVPPAQRMENLRHYYENDMGWSAGPHAFIDGKSWWIFTPFNVKGVHSPSWNGTMLGFECVGDYATESDESGMGAEVMKMAHALSGEVCEYFGWDPGNLKFHKEDPSTDHDCPGRNMVKSEFIDDVRQYMGDGGDHGPGPIVAHRGVVSDLVAGDTLNIRATSSSSAPIIGQAENDDEVTVVGEAMNGSTRWLRLQFGAAAGTGVAIYGWASSQYIREDQPPPPSRALFQAAGPCSWFGGPSDQGVAPDEGLAFIYSYDAAPHLFLPQQPPGTTGLARRLNTDGVNYVACRWDYTITPKEMLADKSRKALVRAGGRELLAWPADWGPNEATGRVADLSRAAMNALGIETDDPVEVSYPAPGADTVTS